MTATAESEAGPSSRGGKKRPRADGTDIPPEAKKPKASGTYSAFPANPPEPNEIRESGFPNILAKLEGLLEQQKAIKVGGCIVIENVD